MLKRVKLRLMIKIKRILKLKLKRIKIVKIKKLNNLKEQVVMMIVSKRVKNLIIKNQTKKMKRKNN